MLPTITSDLTKSQIKNISQQFIEAISDNGRIIETAELIAKMEAFIKEIRSSKDFIEMVRDEVTKEGSKAKVTVTGVKIELAETGVKYDFSQCNDYDLNCLLEESERLEVQIKERKEFLKLLPKAGVDVVTNFGEVIRIYPPSKSSTSNFKTTISK